jgi:hypothetical protein
MGSNYNGNPLNFPATLVIPDDGDAAAAATWATVLEGLADRTSALVPLLETFWYEFATDSPGVTDVEFTWVKPAGSMFTRFQGTGGGGGGAGCTALVGAGGGGASEVFDIWVPSVFVPPELTITLGRGGLGGGGALGSDPAGENGYPTKILGGTGTLAGFHLEALGGLGALQKPARYSGSWPPSPLTEAVGGVGRGWDYYMYSEQEILRATSGGLRSGAALRGANGGSGEWIGNNDPQAGGLGFGAEGGAAGDVSHPDGYGGIGAGAGGGGSRSRSSAAKGGGGAGGLRAYAPDPGRIQASDGRHYTQSSVEYWVGGRAAAGIVYVTTLRGAVT